MLFTVALSGFVSRKRLSTLAALVFAIAANPVLGDIMPVAMRDYPCLGGIVADLWAGFRNNQATNAVLLVGESGGHGVIHDIRLVEERLNASDDVFRDYLQGGLHR